MNKKVWIPLFVAVAVIVILTAFFLGTGGELEKNGYFANIPWGTDIETVKKKVDKVFNVESSLIESYNMVALMMDNYNGFQGVNAIMYFYCDEERSLNQVDAIFSSEGEDLHILKQLHKELVEKYNKLFGKSFSRSGMVYSWVTKNSTIKIDKFGKSLFLLEFKK